MADTSFEHADQARAALHAIVSDPAYGADALSSAQTMSNLLRDYLPDAPREAGLLAAAAEKNLAGMLRDHVSHGLDVSTAIRLTASSFASSTAYTPDVCTWVASELAIALGLATLDQIPADIAPHFETQTAHALSAHSQDTTQAATQRRGQLPVPRRPEAAETEPPTPTPKTPPRALRLALAILGAVAAIAIAVVITALISHSPTTSRGHAPAAAKSGAAKSPIVTQAATPAASSAPAGGPENVWIAQLASVQFSDGTARLDAVLANIRLDIPQAQVLISSDYASLNPGFWVVYYQGSFSNGVQALAYCAAHGRSTRNQCIGRFLSHNFADHGYQCYPPPASPSAACYRP